MAKSKPQPVLPEYDKVYVGLRFRALRKTHGSTLTKWSELIGLNCSPQKLCNYEQGEDQVPVPFATRACILTGANLDYIYRGMTDDLPKKLRMAVITAEKEMYQDQVDKVRARV